MTSRPVFMYVFFSHSNNAINVRAGKNLLIRIHVFEYLSKVFTELLVSSFCFNKGTYIYVYITLGIGHTVRFLVLIFFFEMSGILTVNDISHLYYQKYSYLGALKKLFTIIPLARCLYIYYMIYFTPRTVALSPFWLHSTQYTSSILSFCCKKYSKSIEYFACIQYSILLITFFLLIPN